MITSIKRVFGETVENLKNEKMLFLSTFMTMTVIFIVLNFFVAYTINLKGINDFVKKNMQIKLYLDNSLTDEGIKNLEKSLLKYSDIESVRYISKEVALKQMVERLQLDFEFSENPLQNVILVNIGETTDVNLLVQTLKTEAGVDEVDSRIEFLSNLAKIIKNINTITIYIYIIIAFPIFIIMFNLIGNSISRRKEDIEVMALVGANPWYIKWPFILEGFIHVFLAISVSMLAFVPLYDFFKNSLESVMPFIAMVSVKEAAKFVLILTSSFGVIVTLIASDLSIRANLRIYGD